jgi:hypothetical protein
MKRLVLVASASILASCGSPDATVSLPYVERDSAGVIIVENRFEAIREGWAVGAIPSLVVGGMDAPEAEQLFRVTGAIRLSDGRLALSNAGTGEIRILSTDGTLLTTHGREGDGPGEFQTPTLLGLLAADSLLVWDQGLRRVSVVHVETGFARSYQVDWNGTGFPLARGMLADGSVVIGGGMSFSSEEGFPTGVIRPPSTFGWVRPDGEEVHLAELEAGEMFARASNEGFMARGLPFGRFSTSAAAPMGVWLGTGDSYELSYHGASGDLERILRLDAPSRTVSDEDVEAYIRVNVDEDTNDENRRRELRSMTREMPIPEHVPPYQSLLVDTEGYLWVGDYQIPEQDVPTWTIFDGDGRVVGRLATPARTRLLEVGPDYILGRTADEFDVESLTMWPLTRLPG